MDDRADTRLKPWPASPYDYPFAHAQRGPAYAPPFRTHALLAIFGQSVLGGFMVGFAAVCGFLLALTLL